MKKESFKNIILVCLVVSSIALTFNMWLQKKLWPDGYNFFSNITNYFNGADYEKKYYLSKENVSYPTKIVITNTEKRSLYTHTETEFQSIIDVIMPSVKSGISEAKYVESNISEWETAIKSSSVYMSYPVAYDYSLFNAILGLSAPKQTDIQYIKELLIYSEPGGKTNILFIKDSASSKFYKTAVMPDEAIQGIISDYTLSDVASLPFSFELNFDMEEEAVEQRVVIEPTVTIPLVDSYAKTVYSMEDINVFDDSATRNNILDAFTFNTAIANRYRDNNNTSVFVDNYGTLKLYQNGTLEYKALDSTKGIRLSDNGQNTYDSFISGVEFVNKLLTQAVPDGNFDINLSSYYSSQKDNLVKLTFDYYIDGKEIKYNNNHNSVTIEIVNGNLTYYSQLFKTYVVSDNQVLCPDAIQALDMLMADSNYKGTVTDLYIGYAKQEDSFMPKWYAKTSDGSTFVIGGDL